MAAGPRVGTTFAGYRIERVLGRGGMSVVYLAEHPRLKSDVALKLLAPELAENDVFRERLLRESRLAASLSHPNVIPVYDTGEEDGVLFISMRFVDGPDLRRLLRDEGPLSPERTVTLCTQVAAALDAAHLRGLVHRDVKPANILVEVAPWHVYVADFGLTKHTDARSGATASGLVGTVDYMAPEQIQGRAVDGRADVYALGCVLFECLTGRPPFQLENDVAVIWAHMRSDPPQPSEIDRSLPRAIDAIVRRALAKDPEDRYATCGELASDLTTAVGSRRRRSASISLLPFRLRVPRWRRRWLVPAALGVATGAIAGALIAGAVSGGTTTVLRSTAPPPDPTLISRVPAEFRATCVDAPPPTLDFNTSVSCRPHSGAVDRIEYSTGVSGSRIRAQLLSDVVARGLATFNRPVRPAGRCGSASQAVRDWALLGARRRAQITPAVHGTHEGRLLCYVARDGWAGMEWTDKRVDVLTQAFGHSPAALYAWWTRHGGPLPP
jgi:serine/threonine-protein kinase